MLLAHGYGFFVSSAFACINSKSFVYNSTISRYLHLAILFFLEAGLAILAQMRHAACTFKMADPL